MNKITLKAEGDKYKIFINEIEIKNISNFHLDKDNRGETKVTMTFKCVLNTKEP